MKSKSKNIVNLILNNKILFLIFIITTILLAVGLTFIIERYDRYDKWFNYHIYDYNNLMEIILIWIGILIALFSLTIIIYIIKKSINEQNTFYRIFHKSLKIGKYTVLIAALPVYILLIITIGCLIGDYSTFRDNYDIDHKNSKNHIKACEKLIDKVYDNSLEYIPNEYRDEFEIINELAEYNNAKAQNMLGLHFLFRSDTPHTLGSSPNQELERAMYWFKKSADNGDKYGQFNIARFYLGHHLVHLKELDKAIHYLNLSANAGFGLAHYYLGQIYKDDGLVDEANKHFRIGATLGDERCKEVMENIDNLN